LAVISLHREWSWSAMYVGESNENFKSYDIFIWLNFRFSFDSPSHNHYQAWKPKSRYVLIIVQRDATQSNLFIILQVHSTCFVCQPHPSSGVHKNVITSSSTGHIFSAAISLQRGQASLATSEGGTCSTVGCSYSFVYSWWWVWLTTKTCRINLQNNK